MSIGCAINQQQQRRTQLHTMHACTSGRRPQRMQELAVCGGGKGENKEKGLWNRTGLSSNKSRSKSPN